MRHRLRSLGPASPKQSRESEGWMSSRGKERSRGKETVLATVLATIATATSAADADAFAAAHAAAATCCQDAPKMAQDGTKMAPRCHKMVLSLRRCPHLLNWLVRCFLSVFRRFSLFEVLKWPKMAPTWPQDNPEMAPRRPQKAPRRP